MNNIGETNFKETKTSFWKKNSKLVPGRPSPKKDAGKIRNKDLSHTSYQDFQDSVDDAWDLGDDEFCSLKDIQISTSVAESSALTVINNHSNAVSEKDCDNSNCHLDEDRKAEALQRLASQKEPSSPQHKSQKCHYPGHPLPLVKKQIQSTLKDPKQLSLLAKSRENSKLEKMKTLLQSTNMDLAELRALCWSGIPSGARSTTWKLLSGYLPANLERRQQVLERKREDYWIYVKQYYHTRFDEFHSDTYRQIHIDIPRMSPFIPLFQQTCVQEMFERILFIWAIRRPASGYVQGINDLVTPFYVVFLREVVPPGADVESFDVQSLSESERNDIEADSFWCMTNLLDRIQVNYLFAHPGIQKKVNQLKDLVKRVNVKLHEHLETHEIDYLQFSFRWMNNLLMRELPLRCTIRLLDTYLSENEGFSSFHLYVCAAFLTNFTQELLREKDFQGLMLCLQNLPTQNWADEEVGLILAEAYKLKYMFEDAPNHLQVGKKKEVM